MSQTWRRFIVIAAFVTAIVAVVVLNARAAGSVAGVGETIHFSEVAHASGIDFSHQAPTLDPKIANIAPHVGALGACVSVADFNNDGWPDLYFTTSRFGAQNALYLNQKDGTFRDVAAVAGVADVNRPGEGVSMGAVWGDYDNDGNEDLLVYKWGYPQLFHNLGIGSTRWTLAVTAADFNDDGWPDLYLANDYGPEELYLNREGKRFELARAGLSDDSKSGMAVALGDVYNRGEHDVFVTNISEKGFLFQGNNLRLNFLKQLGHFKEVATGVVADAGWAWGAQFGDLNNDGLLDLVVANGFISADSGRDYWYGMSKIAGAQGNIFEDAKNWPPIGSASLSGYERSRVLLNRGRAGFVDVAQEAGVTDLLDGRGVAMADLFNNGLLDVVVANEKGRPLLYRNTANPSHWVELKLVGTRSNRSAIGAEVTVEIGPGRQRQVVDGGSGFCSQNDRRLHFGLGDQRLGGVTIRWPSGETQVLNGLAIDQLHVVTEPR